MLFRCPPCYSRRREGQQPVLHGVHDDVAEPEHDGLPRQLHRHPHAGVRGLWNTTHGHKVRIFFHKSSTEDEHTLLNVNIDAHRGVGGD